MSWNSLGESADGKKRRCMSNGKTWNVANSTIVKRERTTKLNTDYVTIYVRIFLPPFSKNIWYGIVRLVLINVCQDTHYGSCNFQFTRFEMT